jgi:hypothetical protein
MHSGYNIKNQACGEHEELHTDGKMESLMEAVETFSIERDPASETSTAKDTSKKGIRFAPLVAEIVAIIPTRDSLSEDEKKEAWWTPTEYHGIRLGAKFLTKEVRKRDKDLIAGIEEAYARALHLACTLSDEGYEELMADCGSQVNCMKGWCARNISARGLERYTSQKHRYERSEFAEETRAAVLRLAGNDTVTAEQLSVFYKEYARSAAVYARFCGEADYLVTITAASTTATTTSIQPALSTPQHAPNRRDLISRSNEPSRGRLMVRQMSQRIETTI